MIITQELNKNQLNRLSEICMGIGHIALAIAIVVYPTLKKSSKRK